MKITRDRKLEVSCLNLVLHPHSQELYIDLLKTIHANKLDIKVRGDDAVMFGSVFKGEEGDVYVGEIFKFLKLNAAEDWFNTLSMELASRNDVSGIVIPENLKPHFKRFQYAFFPSKHRLFMCRAALGCVISRTAQKILRGRRRVSDACRVWFVNCDRRATNRLYRPNILDSSHFSVGDGN